MFEISIECPEHTVEALSDAFEALDALSVSVEDANALSEHESPIFGEPGMPAAKQGWQHSKVLALYKTESEANEAMVVLSAQDFFVDCTEQLIREVPEQDWVRLTQAQFAPVEITPTFWIVPSWHQPPEQATKLIRLDPGLAFGTGTHPTTRMCLNWIARNSDQGLGRVLDYGCGSGILAIGAALHGADAVDAVDIDQAAIQATQRNARENGVTLNAGLPDRVTGQYNLVVANILALPLKVLAPLLCSRLVAGGQLVMAGILERQAQELIDAYSPYCQLRLTDTQEGWILMTSVR